MKPRKRIRKVSPRKRLINATKDVIRELYRIKYGSRCQICGKTRNDLGLFHILPTGRYSRLELAEDNILWAGWFCCHHKFHHDFYLAKDIEKRIQALRGKTYYKRLQKLAETAPKMDEAQIKEYKEEYKRKLVEAKQDDTYPEITLDIG